MFVACLLDSTMYAAGAMMILFSFVQLIEGALYGNFGLIMIFVGPGTLLALSHLHITVTTS